MIAIAYGCIIETALKDLKICTEARTLEHVLFRFAKAGTAEGEGLIGPRPHHFFAPPPPLFALKRKIIKIKKRLETSFFRLYSAIFSLFSLISNARHFVGLLCFSR